MKRKSAISILNKVPWICISCGGTWKAMTNDVCGKNKTGCPVCNRPGDTERRVREALGEMDLGVEVSVDAGEWTPPEGGDGRRRRFDIRVNVIAKGVRERFFIIEVDGEQHFGTTMFFGGVPTDHDAQVISDAEKMKWAFERGIPIVRIPTSVVAWGSAERDRDWVSKLEVECRKAAELCSTADDPSMPLFLYPGSGDKYARHVAALENI